MNTVEKSLKNGEPQTLKFQSLSELKNQLNKKLAGSTEEVRNSPFHIEYTEFGADLYMGKIHIKSFEDKGKLLNAVWDRDWEIILKASKVYAKERRKKSIHTAE